MKDFLDYLYQEHVKVQALDPSDQHALLAFLDSSRRMLNQNPPAYINMDGNRGPEVVLQDSRSLPLYELEESGATVSYQAIPVLTPARHDYSRRPDFPDDSIPVIR